MPEQLQNILRNLQALGHEKTGRSRGGGGADLCGDRDWLALPEQAVLRDALCRARPVGREPDRNRARRAGIDFDVGADGTTVLVPVGKTGQARMLLAEKGLPTSANAVTNSSTMSARSPDLVHAAGDEGPRPRRRDRSHHPVHRRHQGGARSHRHGGGAQFPPRGAGSRPPR